MTIGMSIFKTALGSVGSFFGGIQTYLIVGAVMLVIGNIGGAYVGYRWEHGEVLKLQLADAKYVSDQIKAVSLLQQDQDAITLDTAVSAQKQFDDQHQHFITLTKEIHDHVTPLQDARSCISVGLARSLRAEADGSDAGALQDALGQSDDDCSDATATEVAGWFKAYAEAANHDALQLNLLEAEITRLHDSYNVKDAPHD